MENASKALIMAGSVLMAIIVISLLVIFFSNLREFMGTESNKDSIMTTSEYNNQYEVYARNAYGTELFSLANKIISNNKTEDIKGTEYKPIHLYITLEDNLNDSEIYFQKYNKISKDNDNKLEYNEKEWIANLDYLTDLIKELENIPFTAYGEDNKKTKKTVKEIVAMRTEEQKKLGFNDDKLKSNYNGKIYYLGDALKKYRIYKADLTKIKEQAYRYDRAEYSNITGRLEKMFYTWVKED